MKRIVILHGWGASSQKFSEVKSIIEKKGFKVEIPDLPGFGKRPLTKKVMTFDNYVDFIRNFIGKEKVILIGHSFGGRIAIKFTSQSPTLIEKLILTGASGIRRSLNLKRRIAYVLAKLAKVIFFLPPLSFLSPLFKKLIYYWIGEWDYYESGKLLETFRKVYKEDIREYLPKIAVPTLLVWGEKDRSVPVSDGQFMQRKIIGSKLIVVPGGTHDLPYKMPYIFAEKVLLFIST